jgi:hypothetical protein
VLKAGSTKAGAIIRSPIGRVSWLRIREEIRHRPRKALARGAVSALARYFTGAGAASVKPATILIRPSGASDAKSVPPR